jgi:hypothetical protein
MRIFPIWLIPAATAIATYPPAIRVTIASEYSKVPMD